MTETFNPKMVDEARKHLHGVVRETPLQFSKALSERFGAKVYLKREDLQVVRSYKLRGAYNRMRLLSAAEKRRGVVCASAGNHAQGVAFSCKALKTRGVIFMPKNTPRQKIERVRALGGSYVTIELSGDTFDEAFAAAKTMVEKKHMTMVHPFNDPHVIAGQGTVGAEILEQAKEHVDYVVVPIGGGGLCSGVGSYVKSKSPKTKIIGAEPAGSLSIAALEDLGKSLKGKTVVCVVSGGNNDISRYPEVIERALVYQGLKHYFIIN